jgi:hypothetical protein
MSCCSYKAAIIFLEKTEEKSAQPSPAGDAGNPPTGEVT